MYGCRAASPQMAGWEGDCSNDKVKKKKKLKLIIVIGKSLLGYKLGEGVPGL